MQQEQSFEEKVRSMSGADIINAMCDGLEREWVRVCMISFGGSTNGVCYGCAATNAICQIVGRSFDAHEIEWRSNRKDAIKCDYDFLGEFERSIDALRSGDMQAYNSIAEKIGIAQIHETANADAMTTKNYRELIPQYRELARTQPKQEK
jgi:hypothetical protein